MELIPDLAERTTAITDLMMAITAMIGLSKLRRGAVLEPWRTNLWSGVYLLFIAAALIGTAHHGLVLSDAVYDSTWLAIILSLGVMVGLFVVGLVYDLFGIAPAKRALPIMIAIALTFFGYSAGFNQDFSLFLAYEALALVAALAGYLWLAAKGRSGACVMTLGVLLTIIAATVQGTKAMTFTLIVPFDHNATYHLIQIIGVLFLTEGISRGSLTWKSEAGLKDKSGQ